MEQLAHVGKEEAVLCPALEADRQGAAQEKTVRVGVLQGQLALGRQVHAQKGMTADVLLLLMERIGQLPVVVYFDIFLAHLG